MLQCAATSIVSVAQELAQNHGKSIWPTTTLTRHSCSVLALQQSDDRLQGFRTARVAYLCVYRGRVVHARWFQLFNRNVCMPLTLIASKCGSTFTQLPIWCRHAPQSNVRTHTSTHHCGSAIPLGCHHVSHGQAQPITVIHDPLFSPMEPHDLATKRSASLISVGL